MADTVSRDNTCRHKCLLFIGLLFQAVLIAPRAVKVVTELAYGTPMDFHGYTITAPAPWEYVWSFSSIFILFGLYALVRQSVYKLSIFIVGDVLFAIGPIIWSIALHHHDVLKGKTVDSRWYAFSLLCLPVHILSMYYASELRKDWRAKEALKKDQ